ncbi:MAG: hypothetical protein AB8G05_07800 [Oligoflexales bacterium]
MADQGFTDLRLNSGGSNSDHSIWPSFADMMSVIAMIFMLTMVVLVISNWDLVEQLQKALEVEQRLNVEAEESAKRNANLVTRLSDKESKLSYLQMQIINLQSEKDEQERQLDSKIQLLANLNHSLEKHERDLGEQRQINLVLDKRLRESQISLQQAQNLSQELQNAYQESKQNQENSLIKISGLNKQLVLSQSKNQEKDQEVIQLMQNIESMTIQIDEFQEEQLRHKSKYASLRKKYERLIRPARVAPRVKKLLKLLTFAKKI